MPERQAGKRRVVYPDSASAGQELSLQNIDELSGFLKRDILGDKLMHSVVEHDQKAIDQGNAIKEAINQGVSSFTPDLMFEKMVSNYALAEALFGPRLITLLSGYDAGYVSKNIKIPEFQREIRRNIGENIEALKEEKLLREDGTFTEKGVALASLSLYIEELDNIKAKGIEGEFFHKKRQLYGSKEGSRNYRKGDRYKDISLKKSVKIAIQRNHKKLELSDLRVHERQAKGSTYIIYAIDASGSMRGKKIDTAKKAGVALAYKALDNKDKVGLIAFGADIKAAVEPCSDFGRLLTEITKISASMETDIVATMKKAIELFPREHATKHLIMLSDALPTVGKDPENETIEAAAIAREHGITISFIGISLDEKGSELAKKIAEIGLGRLYIVRNLDELDKIVLEDYFEAA